MPGTQLRLDLEPKVLSLLQMETRPPNPHLVLCSFQRWHEVTGP